MQTSDDKPTNYSDYVENGSLDSQEDNFESKNEVEDNKLMAKDDTQLETKDELIEVSRINSPSRS